MVDAAVGDVEEVKTQECSNEVTEMILGFARRYACLGDLDKWAASRLQVACKYTGLTLVT